MIVDFTGTRDPDFFALRMVHDVIDCLAQRVQSVWLANNHGVQGDAEHQRPLFRLPQHFFELMHDHVGKFFAGMMAN